ncbi:ankyrin repeat domain-containing protein [Streptomyces lavendulae]|uniref:ankyrin repeat domain-containing protein n=1 Tax=Streptomyces lavendulae TaxID=1914 RepID=UPI0036EAD0DC
MSFFEGLIVADPPPAAEPLEWRLGAYEPPPHEEHPPSDWFVPARIPQTARVGDGPDTRLVLTGWEVWPRSLVIGIEVFRRRVARDGLRGPVHPRPGADGLRFGLLLADGRRVTTLDGTAWPAPPTTGAGPRPVLTALGGSGGTFHQRVNLHLSQLPPDGELLLVTEWPAQGVPETRTVFDATRLRAAAAAAVEVWPGPRPPSAGADRERGTPPPSSHALAVPRPEPRPTPSPPGPEAPRADWQGMGYEGWGDPGLIRSRLAAGADPQDPVERPLHRLAGQGAEESVAELARLVTDVDAVDEEGRTPLWQAVAHGRADNAAALLAAGADAWTPRVAGRSPGSLALTTELAPLFADLPGAVHPDPARVAAQRAADEQARVFRGVHTEGLAVAFVAGVDEEEVIRRLGADPDRVPVLDLDAEPGPYGTGPDGFDPYGPRARWFLGVSGVPGGCVLTHPSGYLASSPAVLAAVSPGGRAYGVYFNPKGGTFGHLSVDGGAVHHEEIGLHAGEDSPEGFWLHRFWQWGPYGDMYGTGSLAYACDRAHLRITDPGPVLGPPRRWVELPTDSPLRD